MRQVYTRTRAAGVACVSLPFRVFVFAVGLGRGLSCFGPSSEVIYFRSCIQLLQNEAKISTELGFASAGTAGGYRSVSLFVLLSVLGENCN